MINLDDMSITRVDLPRVIEAKPLNLAYGMIVVYLSTSLALVYIMHQRPRITRVLAEYAGGEESLS